MGAVVRKNFNFNEQHFNLTFYLIFVNPNLPPPQYEANPHPESLAAGMVEYLKKEIYQFEKELDNLLRLREEAKK
ncbi:hypothetical protein CO115_05195 [Candidatus Falkowbacteria bacterium CG_4_9_14_3_um_filter_36_9]|uniref:Uncharacterized protein n=2 Tax=Candidatus Falkowiibacteriota TaxID=1752728 RepID=A0A1J4TBQ0_9BACT|nr:MAG: hypothetical protein AUJ27_01580 [Candidatus Falkowbacteria bacterium CG1_02_37_44]PIV51853.1 MAG: hypothetical protein COS18_01805 [Candidatus Falkowbacteria bacterium CG02_land_8_20_14_3_00_36_14]PIX11136.1 MAG: hypothetical protein COZ73_03460 [Candidatus Falkowbacteria bacterium CG_4_8_14_3_um_filter_36_11]PJA11114.1 MAG: hypothetical protein COX67_01495 [Candidatus Falkowbacteria bacterium CG_4_10_14_0_2_um_filter_36_22]PJB17928.1 MAG: hypothetical protein CO115_05195 [Candidatus F